MLPAIPTNASLASYLASQPPEIREQVIRALPRAEADALPYDWKFWARPEQLEPGTFRASIERSDWLYWVLQAGRGFGKTRTGAETVRSWAQNANERILMIAPTASDVREVMIEGPSGLMSCYPPNEKPIYNPTRHLVTFPSGAIGITRSADEPERLRGPQFTKFWADELAAWRFVDEAWEQLVYGLRLPGPAIRGLISTTPKPIKVFKEIVADVDTVITRGSSYANRANLSDVFYKKIIKPREGTRLGRQEIFAELLEDTPGALWTQEMISSKRAALNQVPMENVVRIVIGVDPAVTSGEDSADTGIIVAGLTLNGHVLVYDDGTCHESPLGWAREVLRLGKKWNVDRVVGETNNGGDLVESNIRAVWPNLPFRKVHASRGKLTRAEPVANLYEQGLVHHVGTFSQLESQMCTYVPGQDEKSPDRMDALVWAITELVIDPGVTQEIVTAGGGYRISLV